MRAWGETFGLVSRVMRLCDDEDDIKFGALMIISSEFIFGSW
jgi:hypothetical protein